MELQRDLGADLLMCLDECTPFHVTPDYTRHATERNIRWARRCLDSFETLGMAERQSLYGINHGGVYPELRRLSATAISEMPFAELNQALINAAELRIESGYLNRLAFNFNYTDFSSVGKIEINYKDLKLIGLKKDKGINGLKTLLLNVFIKNDKTRLLPKAERTGTINIERDRKKFIFNFWWKSILDGLKSSILDTDKSRTKSNKKHAGQGT